MDYAEYSQPLDSPTVARPSRINWAEELARTLLPAIAIVLAVNVFLAQPRTVHGQSMEPNLHENQRVIVDLISLRFRQPRRGEIIILDLPERNSVPLIKRVVGLPGDTVEIKDGAVYLNSEKLDEPYLNQDTWGNMSARVVPENNVFVLGDNRARSNDSRYFGMVPFENILGRAWLCYWPLSNAGLFN
ncbi:MAG: signal peptidase I [Chloroflexi bacterium]|jgi:signal peptidase I|nr:signal peptidase I [Chloroflexota bacterium]